jgi:PST family polysaccharide transporter
MIVYRRVDQLLLGGFGQVRDLARYAAAVRLVDALNIVPVAVATIALPTLAHLGSQPGGRSARADRFARVGFRFLAGMILPIAALGTVAGGTIVALIYGAQYRSAGGALSVLLWAHFFGFSGVLVDQVLIARGQSRSLAALTWAGAVVNVAIDLWAIPRFGGMGAAWGSLVAYSVPFIAGAFMPSVRDVFRSCLHASARPAAAAGLVLAVLWALHPGITWLLPAFVAVSLGALVLVRATTVAELREIASSVAGGAPRRLTGVGEAP